MNAATKTRTQRRMEKRQVLILLVLILVVSLASFTLGVFVGRRGAERDFVQRQQISERILVAKSPQGGEDTADVQGHQQSAQGGSAPAVEEKTELTFYDKLSKDETPPLGSGINLPPEKKPAAKPPIELPEKPIVKKEPVQVAAVPTEPEKKQPSLKPKVTTDGDFSLQVGSFAEAKDAAELKKRLSDKDYPAFVVEADLGPKGRWYRVRLGPYADRPAAEKMQAYLEKEEQIKGFVTRQ